MTEKRMDITQEGLDKLIEGLRRLKTVVRPEKIKAVQVAREHGDLRENAEYQVAREELTFLEKQITNLEIKTRNARVVDESRIPRDKAYLGATAVLRNLEGGETIEYILVSSEESDASDGKISVESPIGKGLLGKKVGDVAEIQIPAGTIKYEIIEIRR